MNSSLFLSQPYNDIWDDYNRSLDKAGFPHWDFVVLTASNSHQADAFSAQINLRKKEGKLSKKTKFIVVPDEGGKRVGSGGATLSVIKKLAKETGRSDFSGLKILVIHSGGDSKRVPQYSALGKLFSPIPRQLPDGRPSTLFDELIIAMSSVPSRMKEGMMLLSGDVLLLFNPLQIDYSGKNAAAISFKEDVNTGKDHGVYLRGEDGNVKKFLHKQTVSTLKKLGAVNDRGYIDIDTGAVIFSPDILNSLFSLISTNGRVDSKKYAKFVNDKARLSLYGDFLYPLAMDSTVEKFYEEKPEGEYSNDLTKCRKAVWDVLSPYNMKLYRLAPAKFVHFGTTKEIMSLMNEEIKDYKELGWSNQVNSSVRGNVSAYNSVLSPAAKVGKNVYLECSVIHDNVTIGDNTLISYVDVEEGNIPSNVVLHGLKLKNGKFVVRIWGTDDNPKENKLFGKKIDEVLWNAEIYPVCNTIREAVKASLNLYDVMHGKGDKEAYEKTKKTSLCKGFNDADSDALMAWNKRMEDLVRMNRLKGLILDKVPVEEAKDILKGNKLTKIQKEWLNEELRTANFSLKIRLYYYIGKALGGAEGEKYITRCFKSVSEGVLEANKDSLKYVDTYRIVKNKVTVKLPLRVNWGGGWTDTCPYCLENGGAVLNTAILLNGEKPVEATIERIDELKVVFDSRDMDVHGEFKDIKDLQNTGDPYDSFALQKAVLLGCGLLPTKGGNLEAILKRLGGGFILHSEVTNVPKGSGLGTSSILATACVKAVLDFVGAEYTDNDIYTKVLCIEQIMSTGGGWEDQAGALTDGIKLVCSEPGLQQPLTLEPIKMSDEAVKELNERFVLIYTGQRRLARNILRDVVGRYIGNDPKSIEAHKKIGEIAKAMKLALEKGDIDEFAKLLNENWKYAQDIDDGFTNSLIDQIFTSIEDLIDAKMVCGAGGGGFIQAVLKKGTIKQQLSDTLNKVFMDAGVYAGDCCIV